MAAALQPSVLLGALHMIVAGPGEGSHAYDASVLQPGIDAPRPRGFRSGDPVPPAAHVGASSSVHAIVAAHAAHGVLGLADLAAGATRAASAERAGARATLLRRIGEAAPVALREVGFVRAMLEIGGRPQGGNLTASDLQSCAASVGPCFRPGHALLVREAIADPCDFLHSSVLCACDVRGVLTTLHCAHDPQGVPVPDLQLIAPRLAVVVRRGVPRITPGSPVVVPAPIAILLHGNVPWAGIGIDTKLQPQFATFANAGPEGLVFEQMLRSEIEASSGRSGVGAVRPAEANARLRLVRVDL